MPLIMKRVSRASVIALLTLVVIIIIDSSLLLSILLIVFIMKVFVEMEYVIIMRHVTPVLLIVVLNAVC